MTTYPPGPKGHFLMGSMNVFRKEKLPFLQSLRQYGDISLLYFGPFKIYYVNSPEYIHQVLVTDADKMNKHRMLKSSLRQVLGNGLFLSDGEFWKRQRKLAQPAFHSKRIGAYADVMVEYARRMLAGWRDGEALDISEEMGGLTMKIVSKTLFDADVESEVAEISDAVTTALTVVGERTESLFPPPDWFPTSSNRAIKRAMVTLNRIIQRFIEDRRASGEDRGDLLSMLLAAQDDEGVGMTDKQVRDEAMTLFGAGHETTAIALTWALYLISQHPEVEARLQEEVDRVLGGRPATLNDLPNLPYTEIIAKEAMRLYPPAWGTTRELIDDVTIGDYAIKKGNFIMLSFHALHHDPRIFDQPDRFDPERFSPANEKTIPKYAYLPFGAGPRVCIGNMFAMMEIRLVLATIAQQFRLAHDPSHAIVPDPVFTLRPRNGMPMTLSKREPLTAPRSDVSTEVAVNH